MPTYIITALFAFSLVLPVLTSIAVNRPCKEWCSTFCIDSCKSALTTPICLGETKCQCLCPTQRGECTATWCDEHCKGKSDERKYEAKCDNATQVCNCQFEAKNKQEMREMPSKGETVSSGHIIEQKFIADESLTNREFKCTQKWCTEYCTTKSGSRKYDASCDEKQTCHCTYPLSTNLTLAMPQMSDLVSKDNTEQAHVSEQPTTAAELAKSQGGGGAVGGGGEIAGRAECKQNWCTTYCESHQNGANNFTAICDEQQTCQCRFMGIPKTSATNTMSSSSDAEGEKEGTKMSSSSWNTHSEHQTMSSMPGKSIEHKFTCTQKWCDDYCMSKANGRKWEGHCDENNEAACKCIYPWHKTSVRAESFSGTGR